MCIRDRRQIIPLNKFKKLTHLIRLGLPADVLKIHQFLHGCVRKDRVAAVDSRQTKSKRLCYRNHVAKCDILRISGNPL